VEQALGQEMANGRVLYTDSNHLKANANPRKVVNEQRPEGVSEYFTQLNAAVEADRKKHEKKPLPGVKKTPEKAATVKNTKVSTTEPESGFMHRDNKPQGLDHRTAETKEPHAKTWGSSAVWKVLSGAFLRLLHVSGISNHFSSLFYPHTSKVC
jgi:hypothetical protein